MPRRRATAITALRFPKSTPMTDIVSDELCVKNLFFKRYLCVCVFYFKNFIVSFEKFDLSLVSETILCVGNFGDIGSSIYLNGI